MSVFGAPIEDRVRSFVQPTATEITLAERALLDELSDGTAKPADSIISAAIAQLGGPPIVERHNDAVNVEHVEMIDRDDPVLKHHRLKRASMLALRRLEQADVIARVDANEGTMVGARTPTTRGGIQIGWAGIDRGRDYQLVESDTASADREPDLFLDGLDDLALDERARRCLREAMGCYRRRLFLSCVNLLAAVNEAAWYAAGEKHPKPDAGFKQALERDNTSEVMKRVSAWLKDGASHADKTRIDELYSHAGVMRALRNYGVHPRARTSPELEEHFNEVAAGLVVTRSRFYLLRLQEMTSRAVARLLAGRPD